MIAQRWCSKPAVFVLFVFLLNGRPWQVRCLWQYECMQALHCAVIPRLLDKVNFPKLLSRCYRRHRRLSAYKTVRKVVLNGTIIQAVNCTGRAIRGGQCRSEILKKKTFEVITGEAWSLAAEAYRKLSSTVMQWSIHKAVQLLYVWYINIYNSESVMH